jgi:hypothetical protein
LAAVFLAAAAGFLATVFAFWAHIVPATIMAIKTATNLKILIRFVSFLFG